jgi:hypothetical protein
MKLRLLVLGLVAGCLSLLACGPVASPYMTKLPAPRAIEASQETATVVFIRPSGFLPGLGVTILDPDARVLGVAMAQSYFAVKVPPGERTFHVISEEPHALKAKLTAGRIYLVEVAPIAVGNQRLFALSSRSKNWPEVPQWLATTSQTEPSEKLPELEKSLSALMDLKAEVAKSPGGARHLQRQRPRAADARRGRRPRQVAAVTETSRKLESATTKGGNTS